jgi:hypothetical protein
MIKNDSPGMACPCCGKVGVKPEVFVYFDVLTTVLSKYFRDKVTQVVSSGYRCRNHHRQIYLAMGWDENKIPWGSRHLKGEATDSHFELPSGKIIPPAEIAYLLAHHINFLQLTRFRGIGVMTNSLHLDIRAKETHWIRVAGKYVYGVDFKALIKNPWIMDIINLKGAI